MAKPLVTKPASSATLSQLLRRAGEVLLGTRRHLAEELIARADKIERLRTEAADEDAQKLVAVILAAIDEP